MCEASKAPIASVCKMEPQKSAGIFIFDTLVRMNSRKSVVKVRGAAESKYCGWDLSLKAGL